MVRPNRRRVVSGASPAMSSSRPAAASGGRAAKSAAERRPGGRAELAFIYRNGAEIERRKLRPGGRAELAFIYRNGAENERRFAAGVGMAIHWLGTATGGVSRKPVRGEEASADGRAAGSPAR